MEGGRREEMGARLIWWSTTMAQDSVGHGVGVRQMAQGLGAGRGMAELLSSGSNRKEKAAGRWRLTRPVEDGGLRQGSSASWIKRGRRNSGAVVLCSPASSGEAKGIHERVELLLRV